MVNKAVIVFGETTITIEGEDVLETLKEINVCDSKHCKITIYDGSTVLNSTSGDGERIRQHLERL